MRHLLTILLLVSTLAALLPPLAAAGPIIGIAIGVTGFVGMAEQGPLDTPILVTSYGEFVTVFGSSTVGLANPWLAPSVAGYFANGGQSLYVVRVATGDDASLIGVDLGPGARTGLQALRDIDEVSIVAIPGTSSQTVQTSMIAHCESEGDRIAILDPAAAADVDEVLAQRAGLGSDDGYAALYFPWVQAAPAGVSLLMPPSGLVAGIYAASDPPDSPVAAIATATDVGYAISSAEQDLLNPQGINAIRYFAGQGVRVWGSRTIASSLEWIYVAVRRSALHLEESIQEGTVWAVFEPNDAFLWAQLRSDVGDFLNARWVEGWFQGAQAQDAYFVQCGLGTTMTQNDIDEGRTIVLFGVAPVRPAEFVILSVTQQHVSSTASGPAERRSMVLHPAAPNPFNPSTVIRFELASAQQLELRVYDLAGRLVRVLEPGREFGAGEHRVAWDGRDDTGRTLASGSYAIRLQGPDDVSTQRVTLLK